MTESTPEKPKCVVTGCDELVIGRASGVLIFRCLDHQDPDLDVPERLKEAEALCRKTHPDRWTASGAWSTCMGCKEAAFQANRAAGLLESGAEKRWAREFASLLERAPDRLGWRAGMDADDYLEVGIFLAPFVEAIWERGWRAGGQDERGASKPLDPRCGECRLGLGIHDTADPQCDHHTAPDAITRGVSGG